MDTKPPAAEPGTESQERVLFYEVLFYMFSNFSSFMVEFLGLLWPTAEHAYQAAKFTDPELREKIRNARSAHDAKKIARENDALKRPNWDSIKIPIMKEILRCKRDQHPYVKESLMKTRGKILIEDSPKDSFWGRGPDWKGHNHLGKLWMELRDEAA